MRLFDGVHPRTGESLGEPYRVRDGADRVTGWDLTFSAPKSVSALWATVGGEVGMEVRDAHDAAVAAALDYLEDHAALQPPGQGGSAPGRQPRDFWRRRSSIARRGPVTRSCTPMSWFPDGCAAPTGCGGRWTRGRCTVS